jgi:ABC-type antimicrobial peptide transport system permease subunit
VARIADQISREYSDYGSAGRVLVGLQREATGQIRPGLLALLGGVALVLMTACLNVAGLLIARASARAKETAVRLAIGASRGQLIRQCLVEGLILAFIGGVVGVLFGEVCLRGLVALRPAALTWVSSAAIDTKILGFTFGTALLCGLLCSFAPMIDVIRLDFLGSLWGGKGAPGACSRRAGVLGGRDPHDAG